MTPLRRGEGAVISEPEIGVTLLPKGVAVLDPAVKIDRLNLLVNVVNLGVAQSVAVPHRFWHDAIRTDGRMKFVFQLGRYQGFFVSWLCDHNLCPANHLVGGGLSGILKSDYDENLIPALGHWFIQHHAFQNVGTLWKNVSPQLAASGSHHDPYGSDQGEELKEANENSNSSDPVAQTPTPEPTVAPLVYSMIAGGFGFFFCVLGLLNFENDRRLLAVVQLGSGLLLGGFGFLLWTL